MREKILAQLRAKFGGVSLVLLGLIADKIATKITDEAAIEGEITALDNAPIGVADYARFLQTEGDRRVTEALNKPKPAPTPNDPKPEPKPADPSDPNADLRALVTSLATTVGALVTKDKSKTVTEQITAKLTEQKIPLSILRGRNLENVQDIDAEVAIIKDDFLALQKDLNVAGFQSSTPPTGGLPGPSAGATLDDDIKNWAKQKDPTPATATT